MAGISQIETSVLVATVRDKLSMIAESLNQCFDAQFQLEAGELRPFENSASGMDLLQPGLIVTLWLGDESFLCAVPETLPLPEWYTQPDMNQQARLDTLAMEWSLNCLPDDQPAEEHSCNVVPSLWDAIQRCQPTPAAQWLPLVVSTAEGPAEASIWLLWPATAGPWDSAPAASPIDDTAGEAGSNPTADRALRVQRLISVPVPVIVKLAEKKIELGQLMVLGPGTIVTFEKSCEDLLDLYVNNQLYCRGEAVKIGEKFGIKINEVGSIEERVSAVLGLGD